MKRSKILVALLLCLSLAGAAGCISGGSSGEEDSNRQLVEVVRGNLAISVSGSGFIGTSDEVVLTF
ncbi:MAG: hypothetical protein PHI12_11515, partial [Dehalococcoidales bacterium]|nr:hypothetical protein [Dehalococcoidales bacterium]